MPARVWLLTLLLPLWMLGGAPSAERSIQLPISTVWRRRLRSTSGAALVLMPLVAALVLAAINDWFGLSLAFVILAGAVCAASLTLTLVRESWQPRYGERMKDDSGRLYIRLRGVDPAFRAAVEEQYRAPGTT